MHFDWRAPPKGYNGMSRSRAPKGTKRRESEEKVATIPKRVSERHLVAASFVASGARRSEIARALGLSPFTVSHLKRSPAFQVEVARFQRRLDDAFGAALVDRLVGRPRPWPRCGRADRLT